MWLPPLIWSNGTVSIPNIQTVKTENADPDQTSAEQSDQNLYCLPFSQHLLDKSEVVKQTHSNLRNEVTSLCLNSIWVNYIIIAPDRVFFSTKKY